MGIRFYCTDCGRRLNIKAFLAGKRGICPHCDARVLIPFESQIPGDAPKYRPASAGKAMAAQVAVPQHGVDSGPEDADQDDIEQDIGVPPESADPIAEAPDAVWYVRPPSGGQYGPARGDVMRRWIEEGRVSSDSMVWREGWAEWQTAGPMFPVLDGPKQVTKSLDVGISTNTAPSFVAPGGIEHNASSVAASSTVGARRKKPLALLIVLGLLIIVLLVVTVVVIVQTGA